MHLKGGGYIFTEVKSKSGNRTIILGKQALEILKVHKREQPILISLLAKIGLTRIWSSHPMSARPLQAVKSEVL